MNYINYYIIKAVKLKLLHKYFKNLYFYIIIFITIKEL